MHADTLFDVLVVDDDPGMRKSLRRILLVRGFAVRLAASGEEALEAVRAQPPSCVLMDIKMPGMDGVEAYRRIRRLAPEAAVLFMTAYASSELADQARSEGMFEVLGKPLDVPAVCAFVERLCSTRPILVVDDDPAMVRSIERVLTERGYVVRTAAGCEQALRHLEREPRCLLILDLKLDGGSGLDVLAVARRINPGAAAILITGCDEMEPMVEKGRRIGAVAAFTKPFDMDALVASIDSAVRRKTGVSS